MSGTLLLALLLTQAAPAAPQRSMVEPFKDILPSFGLSTEKEKSLRSEAAKRALLAQEEFLMSAQAKRWPDTLSLFLGRADYARMQGNTIMGYWWVSPNFLWKREWKGVYFNAPKGVHESSKPIQPEAWTKAMDLIGNKRGLALLSSSAPIKISGAVVGAVLNPKEDKTRGFATICEWRIQSPGGGELVYRYAVMKPTLGGAIGANLDWVLTFAQGIDGVPKKFGKFVIPGTAKGLNDGPAKR